MSRLRLFGVIIPVAIGILSGLIAQANWVTIQLFLNGQAFGITDPQFNMDVSFYTFDLPFYRFVLNWLFVSILLAFVANLITHYVFGGIKLAGRAGTFTTAARVQLAVLAGTFVLLKAVATGSIATRCFRAAVKSRRSPARGTRTSWLCSRQS